MTGSSTDGDDPRVPHVRHPAAPVRHPAAPVRHPMIMDAQRPDLRIVRSGESRVPEVPQKTPCSYSDLEGVERGDGEESRGAPRAAPAAPAPSSVTQRRRPTAYGWVLGLLDALGSGPIGGKVRQCPAHQDGAPSLSIGEGDGGRALLHCHAGCSTEQVATALRIPMARLFLPVHTAPEVYARRWCHGVTFPPLVVHGGGRDPQMRHESWHYYGEGFRKERLRNPTTGAKTMRWECRNPHGEWVPGLLGTRESTLPLYRETDVRMGMAVGEPVLLVESESSVDALRGWYATTWAGGAGTPALDRLHAVLAGHDRLVIVPDNDDAGRACLARLVGALPLARVLMPDHAGEDARDLHTRLGDRAFRARVAEVLDTEETR